MGILFCILVSSVTLAMYDYADREGVTTYNRTLEIIGHSLSFVFLVESILKIVAVGFDLHENSYLRDAWNVIDFVIVISG